MTDYTAAFTEAGGLKPNEDVHIKISTILGSHYLDLQPGGTGRHGDLGTLVSDGALLLREIDTRRAAIRSLFTGTIGLSQQITAMVQENQATLHPALVRLHRVVGILERNQGNLDKAVQVLGPFVTTSGDATSSGRWFDGYLQNLIPVPLTIKPPAIGAAK